MKIAVYAICKNEEKHAERWLDSLFQNLDYDQIVVCDTGSTDETALIMEDRTDVDFYSLSINPWRFDDARNAALSLVRPDIDMCICLDIDEVLVGDWRTAIKETRATRPRYQYVWSWNPDGSRGVTYWGEKVHARHGYRWKHPVHEILVPTAEETVAFLEDAEVHHYPDTSKSRSNYLPLLELAVKEDPTSKRNVWYLGREYFFQRQKEKSVATLLDYLDMPGTWGPERSAAYRLIGDQLRQEHWYLRAIAEAPNYREPFVSMSIWHHDLGNWADCFYYAQKALAIQEKPKDYICEAYAWGDLPARLSQIAIENLKLT